MSPKKLAKIMARYNGCTEAEALRRWKADRKAKKKKDRALALGTQPKRGGGSGGGSGASGSGSGRQTLMDIITGGG